jgi:DNA-binding transcriptional regulator LsrR (DeoR family)
MLDHFNKQTASQLTFTQFMGENMRYHSSAASMQMVQKAAAKYDVPYQTIPGPLYIINDQARTALYHEPAFTAAFTAARPDGYYHLWARHPPVHKQYPRLGGEY